MPTFGFVGPTYQGFAIAASADRCVNLFLEQNGPHGKSTNVLYGTPGRKLFATLPTGPVRALWAGDNRLFAVGGSKLYEVFPNGTVSASLADVGGATTPAYITSNGNQLMVISGALASIVSASSTVDVIDTTPAVSGCFMDGYFIVQDPDSNSFHISSLLLSGAAPYFTALNFGVKQGAPDRLVRIIADHQELWLFGRSSTEVWYNSGNNNFPFQRIQGAFIEQGCAAAFSVAKLDNSLFWLGGDDRGGGFVWRTQGYRPVRVSNHAVENAIQSYSNIYDAVAYSYQEEGHSFYVLSFPSADATWVYDVATNMWHERGRWSATDQKYHADQGRSHAYVAGTHFVGDYQTGAIYTQALNIYDDAGLPKRWLRSAPHISNENKVNTYRSLQLDMEVGQAPDGKDPQVMLQLSNDGGYTWSNERWVSSGKTGKHLARAKWRRLGTSRDRCFRVVGSDPIKVALVEAYLETTPGTGT